MRRRTATAACLGALLLAAAMARADAPARVTTVAPARAGELVVCRLRTEGLPGQKLLQSMRSGLVSAVDLDLALVDERSRVVAGHRVSLQLAFDLWEEIFSVRTGDRERRFHSLEDLRAYLADLRDLPVAPLERLAGGARYRVRVDLALQPVAPAVQDRVEDAIAGGSGVRREGQDQQEAQVSLGRLIRFFYDEKAGRDAGAGTASPWFTREELRDATH